MKDSYLPGRHLQDPDVQDAFEALSYAREQKQISGIFEKISAYGRENGFSQEQILCAFFLQGHHCGIQTLYRDLVNWFPKSEEAIDYCQDILDI